MKTAPLPDVYDDPDILFTTELTIRNNENNRKLLELLLCKDIIKSKAAKEAIIEVTGSNFVNAWINEAKEKQKAKEDAEEKLPW